MQTCAYYLGPILALVVGLPTHPDLSVVLDRTTLVLSMASFENTVNYQIVAQGSHGIMPIVPLLLLPLALALSLQLWPC